MFWTVTEQAVFPVRIGVSDVSDFGRGGAKGLFGTNACRYSKSCIQRLLILRRFMEETCFVSN